MRWYRFYCLVEGRIVSGEDLKAEDDAEAIRAVQARGTGYECELWLGTRRVATIPAESGEREPTRF